ncbi:methyl-accepting chemotaxis protein [Azospirillum sp. CT11-132]|uniref:methyl-accepting chemotaxis protein n=1 Tax=unclassified Azospirillum TaxID=2630922 RepID=UPI000D60EE6F|nr:MULTISPECIES: methyl-accepting chemotaxis protein [unclassified Azospirillum]PWC56604.1 chemotaxis protein [Azospirillum sp. TSH20]PWC59811.1 chemotaxis protein [Azospirillum sp. TSH7]
MNMKVAHKLVLGFGVVCVLTALLALYQMSRFSDALDVIMAVSTYDNEAAKMVTDVSNMQAELRSSRETALNAVSIANAEGRVAEIPALLAPVRRHYDEVGAQLRDRLGQLRAMVAERSSTGVTDSRRRGWVELDTSVNEMSRAITMVGDEARTIYTMLERNQIADALQRRQRVDELRKNMEARIAQAQIAIDHLTQAGRADIRSIYNTAIQSSVIALVVVFLIAVGVAFLIGSSITRRLGRAIDFVTKVGHGDLTQEIAIAGKDELAILGQHLNEMAGRLKSMARTTRETAESVHAATAQIRASTQQQSASVAEQLAAVEQTTATLSEITESGAQINRRAQDVSHGAQTVAASSHSGMKAVDDTIQAMDAIREQAEAVAENIVMLSERTQAIGEIIVTVNDIAERCHLLALNAAIEAAAAGEHGRTFSIVAGEIKSLADQSKEATAQVRSNLSEIQHGINASVMLTEEAVKRVAAGKRQTDATQSTIRTMAENIQESVLAFQQIVAGTNQQQIGLEQVIQALQNIREASSQTAAGTRQLEGAAANLNNLGQGLVEAVRNYRV